MIFLFNHLGKRIVRQDKSGNFSGKRIEQIKPELIGHSHDIFIGIFN